jgi:hypothetical protein
VARHLLIRAGMFEVHDVHDARKILVAIALTLAATGCGQEATAAAPDASSLLQPDASTLLQPDASAPLDADVDAAAPDADVDAAPDDPDAGPDADVDARPAPDAGPGPVQVTVFGRWHHPIAGANVIVQTPAGEVYSTTTTDAAGNAWPDLREGDQVTVAMFDETGAETRQRLITWQGVPLGVHLTCGRPENEPLATVSVTGPGLFPGAAYYAAWSSDVAECSEPENVFNIDPSHLEYTVVKACHRAAYLPVRLVAYDANLKELAWALRDDVPIVDGRASVSFPGWHTDVVPITASSLHPHSVYDYFSRAVIFGAHGGESFASEWPITPQGTDNSTGVGQVPVVHYAPAWSFAETTGNRGLANGYGSRRVVRSSRGPLPSSFTTDHATAFLPSIVAVTRDDADPARFRTRFSFGSDGDPHVLAAVYDFSIQASELERWIVVAPGGSPTVKLPALPDALVAFRPVGGPLDRSIDLFDASDLEYRDLVQESDRLIDRPYDRTSLPRRESERTTRWLRVDLDTGI